MALIKGDFNGNGRSEIPVSSPWGLGLLELSGNSLGSPMMASNGTRFGDWLLNTADNHFDLVGDLDGDGRDEVLVTSPWGAARFLLARAPEGNRRPLLRVRAAAMTGDDTPRIALEFQARPVVDSDRLDAARPQLETAARQRGGTGALDLEIMPDPQPVLRLALPQNGVPNPAMTVRSDADIDLETGVAHGETMSIEDFQLIYQALFGGSLTLLRGEVRAAMSGGDPEDVPLELRIDKTTGDVLNVSPGAATAEGLKYSLTNAIESPVRIDRVAAACRSATS